MFPSLLNVMFLYWSNTSVLQLSYFEDASMSVLRSIDNIFQMDNLARSQFYKSLPSAIRSLPKVSVARAHFLVAIPWTPVVNWTVEFCCCSFVFKLSIQIGIILLGMQSSTTQPRSSVWLISSSVTVYGIPYILLAITTYYYGYSRPLVWCVWHLGRIDPWFELSFHCCLRLAFKRSITIRCQVCICHVHGGLWWTVILSGRPCRDRGLA